MNTLYWFNLSKWHGRLAREITRRMRVPPQLIVATLCFCLAFTPLAPAMQDQPARDKQDQEQVKLPVHEQFKFGKVDLSYSNRWICSIGVWSVRVWCWRTPRPTHI